MKNRSRTENRDCTKRSKVPAKRVDGGAGEKPNAPRKWGLYQAKRGTSGARGLSPFSLLPTTSLRAIPAFLIFVTLLAGCATTPPAAPPATAGPNSAITYAAQPDELALVLRELGPALDRNVALMHGVHNRTVGPYDFRDATSESILDTLSEDAALVRMPNRTYELLAPADYRQLNTLDLRNSITGTFTLPDASIAIGADTPLFDALALLSQALNTTLIADNAVADARSGELALPGINGVDALEALIKSARLDQAAFQLVTGDNYLLFHATGNPPRTDIIANRETLTEQQRTLLNRRVNLRLPQSTTLPAEIGAYAGATPLINVLPNLSTQLGVTVTADPQLHQFPVNPCHMNNVTIETALKLIINQWLAQDFVIDVRQSSLHLRPDN